MLGKDLFDEFMKPYYARVIPALQRRNIPAIVDLLNAHAMDAHAFLQIKLGLVYPHSAGNPVPWKGDLH